MMTSSYELIDYALRPAKHAERKMIVETMERLRPFRSLRRYRYIGFGSIAFRDFALVHRALGITNLVSIEKDVAKVARFRFNQPYRRISLEMGHSNAVLARMTWRTPSIVWLDYDDPLTPEVLVDIDTVVTSVPSGSMLIISVNAQPTEQDGRRAERLAERLGSELMPPGVNADAQLAGWKTAGVYRTIISARIEAVLRDRNGGAPPTDTMRYRQLFNFRYADDARILTVGGIFFREDHIPLFRRCQFDELRYLRYDADGYRIRTPILTHREARHLDRQLPQPSDRLPACPGVPERDRRSYRDNYRYLPAYVDADY
jgi:hypothetical protein